jgi:hypothetical protein
MAKEKGFFLLYRDIFEHWIFQEPITFKAWIYILGHVNHTDNKILYNGELITIQSGQMLTSIRKLASAWGCTEKKARVILNALKNDGMILMTQLFEKSQKKGTVTPPCKGTVKTNPRGTVLTVVNWAFYQNQGHSNFDEFGHSKSPKKGTVETTVETYKQQREQCEQKIITPKKSKKKNEQPHDRQYDDDDYLKKIAWQIHGGDSG